MTTPPPTKQLARDVRPGMHILDQDMGCIRIVEHAETNGNSRTFGFWDGGSITVPLQRSVVVIGGAR